MHRLPSIPPAEVKNLRMVCDELGLTLTADTWDWLQFIVHGVRLGEASGGLPSVPQRKKDLSHIAELAHQLNDTLQSLMSDDRSAIHQGFKVSQIRMRLDPPDPVREVFMGPADDGPHDIGSRRDIFCENVLLLGDVLLTLEVLAKQSADGLAGPMNGGRPPELVMRAGGLAGLARFAHQHGIPVGRGRHFVRLAEAVFSAAGVSVSPEPAIRFFVAEFLPGYLRSWEEEAARGDEEGGATSG